MDKIYKDYDNRNVVATRVYAGVDDEYVYSDSSKTEKIPAAGLKDLFEQGVIIVDGNAEYKPISFTMGDEVATLTYVKTNSEAPTTAVLVSVKSEEPVTV